MDTQYYICFSDDTTVPLLKFLKPGFRHCFALIKQGENWISYDPILPRTELRILPLPGEFDLIDWMEEQGITVVKTELKNENPTRCAPPGFFTCVEAMKRLLGIHSMRIQTPGQLYRYLVKG